MEPQRYVPSDQTRFGDTTRWWMGVYVGRDAQRLGSVRREAGVVEHSPETDPTSLDGAPVVYRRLSLVALQPELPHDRPHPATQVMETARPLQREIEIP